MMGVCRQLRRFFIPFCVLLFIVIFNILLFNRIFHGCHDDEPKGRTDEPTVNPVSSCTCDLPCHYLDEVDLRIIVLTFNRSESLSKLLTSLNDLEMDGDLGAIEIWIDRSKNGDLVDARTLGVAMNFRWSQRRGQVRVHVQQTHVGIYGQWIETWRPRKRAAASEDDEQWSKEEVVLLVEDDLSISPFAYRWLKAAHNHYAPRRDVAGVTLQSEGLIIATSGAPFRSTASDGPSFAYSLVGSWGFSPRPEHWSRFQDWFQQARKDARFHPYVPRLVVTSWFKIFEKQGRADSMWTMWFIHFTWKNRLVTIYNNLDAMEKHAPADSSSSDSSSTTSSNSNNCLVVNRREPGLHYYAGQALNNTGSLLRRWSDGFTHFKEPLRTYGFDGKPLP